MPQDRPGLELGVDLWYELRHTEVLPQVELLLCHPSVGLGDPAQDATRAVANLLGGGLSSRLFTWVREDCGLVVAVLTCGDRYDYWTAFVCCIIVFRKTIIPVISNEILPPRVEENAFQHIDIGNRNTPGSSGTAITPVGTARISLRRCPLVRTIRISTPCGVCCLNKDRICRGADIPLTVR